MTDAKKREALEWLVASAKDWRNNVVNLPPLVVASLDAIAADYSADWQLRADAEWIRGREGWEHMTGVLWHYSIGGLPGNNIVLFFHDDVSFCIQLYGHLTQLSLNPTRAQVAALEVAVGGKKS